MVLIFWDWWDGNIGKYLYYRISLKKNSFMADPTNHPKKNKSNKMMDFNGTTPLGNGRGEKTKFLGVGLLSDTKVNPTD
jgi:hypothetical protein